MANLDQAFSIKQPMLAAKKPGYILKERKTEAVVHDQIRNGDNNLDDLMFESEEKEMCRDKC